MVLNKDCMAKELKKNHHKQVVKNMSLVKAYLEKTLQVIAQDPIKMPKWIRACICFLGISSVNPIFLEFCLFFVIQKWWFFLKKGGRSTLCSKFPQILSQPVEFTVTGDVKSFEIKNLKKEN